MLKKLKTWAANLNPRLSWAFSQENPGGKTKNCSENPYKACYNNNKTKEIIDLHLKHQLSKDKLNQQSNNHFWFFFFFFFWGLQNKKRSSRAEEEKGGQVRKVENQPSSLSSSLFPPFRFSLSLSHIYGLQAHIKLSSRTRRRKGRHVLQSFVFGFFSFPFSFFLLLCILFWMNTYGVFTSTNLYTFGVEFYIPTHRRWWPNGSLTFSFISKLTDDWRGEQVLQRVWFCSSVFIIILASNYIQ